MRVAVTGGTGFVGRHLARRLADDRHDVVVVSRSGTPPGDLRDLPNVSGVAASVADREGLETAFEGCDAVAHLAGINREHGDQTYDRVHVQGTARVVAAAEAVGVSSVVLTSYLRASPACGSAYLESKWAAETVVRDSGLDWTVLKPGVVYGAGDHMLEHLSRWLATAPVFASVGLRPRRLRPVAIADMVDVLVAGLVDDRLSTATVPVLGPEELSLDETVRRVGAAVGRDPLIVPAPVALHTAAAVVQEAVMETPVTARAQVRMLAEGITEPAPEGVCDRLPPDLQPSQPFTVERISRAVDDPEPYGLGDLRW